MRAIKIADIIQKFIRLLLLIDIVFQLLHDVIVGRALILASVILILVLILFA